MIETPPHITPELQKRRKEIVSSSQYPMIAAAVNKINDEYLYWSDIKYRAKQFDISSEELWAIVKY